MGLVTYCQRTGETLSLAVHIGKSVGIGSKCVIEDGTWWPTSLNVDDYYIITELIDEEFGIWEGERWQCAQVPAEGDILGYSCGIIDGGGRGAYKSVADGMGGENLVRDPEHDAQCQPTSYCRDGLRYRFIPDDLTGGGVEERDPENDHLCAVGSSGSRGSGSGSTGSGGSGSRGGSSSNGGSSSRGSSHGSSGSRGSSGSGSRSHSGSGSSHGSASASSGSSSGSRSSGSPSSGSSGSSKTAIVKAGPTWIAWQCIESDRPYFDFVCDVLLRPVARIVRRVRLLEATRRLPDELMQSIEPGSLSVIEATAVDGMAAVTGDVVIGSGEVAVAAVVPRGLRRLVAVRLRLRGLRAGGEPGWPRFTAEQAASNDSFYASATLLKP